MIFLNPQEEWIDEAHIAFMESDEHEEKEQQELAVSQFEGRRSRML